MDEKEIIKTIKLDILIGDLEYKDQFEWDIANPDNDPEENLSSPFSELGLLSHGDERGIYQKNKPLYSRLDSLAVLYVIVSNMSGDKHGAAINALLTEDNNIGKLFHLDRSMANDYLDRLRQEGYIQINRTAGLDMIYLKENITPKEILELYYQQNETEV